MKTIVAAGMLCLTGAASALAQGAPDVVAMLDANKDGAISRAEFSAVQSAKFDQSDANKDGKLTGDERANHHGRPGPEQTKEQYLAQGLGVFDGEDTNKDGTISGDEVGRFRAHVMGGSRPVPPKP